MTVTAERCIELIKAKRQADIDKYIKTFPENPGVQVSEKGVGEAGAIRQERPGGQDAAGGAL